MSDTEDEGERWRRRRLPSAPRDKTRQRSVRETAQKIQTTSAMDSPRDVLEGEHIGLLSQMANLSHRDHSPSPPGDPATEASIGQSFSPWEPTPATLVEIREPSLPFPANLKRSREDTVASTSTSVSSPGCFNIAVKKTRLQP